MNGDRRRDGAASDLPVTGHAALQHFMIDPKVLHVNHGSYGGATRRAFEARLALARRIEARPSAYFRRDYWDDLDRARQAAAGAFGGDAADYALVDNATTGCNAVIASLDLAPGDEVLVNAGIYGAVRKALAHHLGRKGARIVEAPLPLPLEDETQVLDAVERHLGPRTRLAVFDHIVSTTATRLPVARLAELCRDRGVPVLIDGAHAPGQLPLDIPAIGADFYAGNAHKWLCAPKGGGFLWVAPKWQERVHPTVISHGAGAGFAAEFGWTGARDPSAMLSLPTALDAFAALGGARLMARNAALAREAADLIAASLGTWIAAAPQLCDAMATIRLPLASGPVPDTETAQAEFGARYGVDTSLVPLGEGIGVRLSAHLYNEMDDYERLLVGLRDFFSLPARR